MKKIILSTLALASIVLSADVVKLYVDESGQTFTTPADNRVEIGNINSKSPSISSKLKFSGTHYLGFKHQAENGESSTNNFEMRRNYVQVKAHLLEDPKSYLRVTLDATYTSKTADGEGHADAYVKYAYLYLNDILPQTGVEVGMVHRPWIDYEEHQGWWMRSISKVFVEAGEGAHLTNSADLGFNFKTKTDYFTSEAGIFNGEGYHGTNDLDTGHEIGAGVSAEWRATGAFFGNGKIKRDPLKDSYLDASFFGQINMYNSQNAGETYMMYGLHSVYNQPEFLVAAQVVMASNSKADSAEISEFDGFGYSLNGTYRMGEKKEYSALLRLDYWDTVSDFSSEFDETKYNIIFGVAWQQNKNVKWLLSGQGMDYMTQNYKDSTEIYITAEVHW